MNGNKRGEKDKLVAAELLIFADFCKKKIIR